MKTIFVMALGATAVLSSTALAQPLVAPQRGNEASQTLVAPYTQPAPVIQPFRRFLFTIGNVPVTVWAPVQPPYNSRANRTGAANPLWWDEGGF
jgi:hypothetical protein